MVTAPNYEDYVIWHDKTYTAPFSAAATPGGVVVIKKKFKPYMTSLYTTDQGDSLTKGSLRIIMIGSADVAVKVSMSARLYFKDV